MRVVGCTSEPGAYAGGAMRKKVHEKAGNKHEKRWQQKVWGRRKIGEAGQSCYYGRMGRRRSGEPRGSGLLGELEGSSIQEQTDTRQGENCKESLIRHSRLLRRDHHNFNHGQRDGLAQEHFFKDQKTRDLLYNIYPPEKSSVVLLAQN